MIDPADRDALEVGLLLAEVERRLVKGARLSVFHDTDALSVGRWDLRIWVEQRWPGSTVQEVSQHEIAHGKTFSDALTALLAQLEDTK